MAQARTGDKNLVGGLLVPLEVIDSQALITEGSCDPSSKPVRNRDRISFIWDKVGQGHHAQPATVRKVRYIRSGSASR
jgi:hypothetical protein